MARPVRQKRDREKHAPRSSPPARSEFGVAAILLGWGVLWLGYVVLFYAAPLSHSQAGRPISRASLLLLAFTPELYWETWTGGPAMRLGIADRIPILTAAGVVLFFAYALGRVGLAAIDAHRGLSRIERFVFAEGVGLNLLSLLALGLGLARWHTQPIVWIAIGALAISAWGFVVFKTRGRESDEMPLSDNAAPRDVRWLWLAAPMLLVILFGAILPPWEFDVREYHLQVPKEWFRRGRIDFLPHNVYGNMPLGAEVFSLPAMALCPGERDWWWGSLVGKTVMAAFAPLTALGLFAAGRRFFSSLAGVTAALVYISIPWVAHTAMAGLNDHVLACFVFLAFYAMLLWRRKSSSLRFLLLSGFLAGAAAACKYTGVLFAIVPLGILSLVIGLPLEANGETDAAALQRSRQRPLLAACGFAIAALLACFPWYAKNWALSGNPVYPLAYTLFDGETRTPEKAEQWRRAHQVPRSEASGPYSLERLASAAAQIGWRSDWLSPLLVPLLLLAPLQSRSRRVLSLAAAMVVFLLAVWWLFTHRIDRFWIPALPAAALLAGAGAAWRTEGIWKVMVLSLVTLGVFANWLVIASPWIGDNRFLVALEDLRTDVSDPSAEYIGRVSAAHGFLNETVPPAGAVLLVGDAQPFDLEMPVYYNTAFDDNAFEQLTKGRTPEEIREALQQLGITHVYVNWPEIARYRSPGNYGFTDYVQPKRFEELVAQGILRELWSAPHRESRQDANMPPKIYEIVGQGGDR